MTLDLNTTNDVTLTFDLSATDVMTPTFGCKITYNKLYA